MSARDKADADLQRDPVDLALANQRRSSRSGRALAAASLLAVVGGAAYFTAADGPLPAGGSAALQAPAASVVLRLDGDWQATATVAAPGKP